MNSLTEKRVKQLKTRAILIIIYEIAALAFFALNKFGVVDIFDIEKFESSTVGMLLTFCSCIIALISGIILIANANDRTKDYSMYIMTSTLVFLIIIINAVMGVSSKNLLAFVVIMVGFLFVSFCASTTGKLYKGK